MGATQSSQLEKPVFFRSLTSQKSLNILSHGKVTAKGGWGKWAQMKIVPVVSDSNGIDDVPCKLSPAGVSDVPKPVSQNDSYAQDAPQYDVGALLRQNPLTCRIQNVGDPAHFLRIDPSSGQLDGFGTATDDFSILQISHDANSNIVTLTSWLSNYAVGASSDGRAFCQHSVDAQTRFELVPIDQKRRQSAADQAPEKMMSFPAGSLNETQKMVFRQNGFIVVSRVVPPDLVDQALRQINAKLGSGFSTNSDGAQDWGALHTHSAITDLYLRSPAFRMVESLIGQNLVTVPQRAQIALRFSKEDPGPNSLPPNQWHIDGMKKTKLNGFTVLAGVALSDWSKPFCGQLVVWPGSHTEIAAQIGKLGGEAQWCRNRPELSMAPVQLQCRPGDLILCHPLLAHRPGPNNSSAIRYATYSRMRHIHHAKLREVSLTDPWVEFEC